MQYQHQLASRWSPSVASSSFSDSDDDDDESVYYSSAGPSTSSTLADHNQFQFDTLPASQHSDSDDISAEHIKLEDSVVASMSSTTSQSSSHSASTKETDIHHLPYNHPSPIAEAVPSSPPPPYSPPAFVAAATSVKAYQAQLVALYRLKLATDAAQRELERLKVLDAQEYVERHRPHSDEEDEEDDNENRKVPGEWIHYAQPAPKLEEPKMLIGKRRRGGVSDMGEDVLKPAAVVVEQPKRKERMEYSFPKPQSTTYRPRAQTLPSALISTSTPTLLETIDNTVVVGGGIQLESEYGRW